jgi:CRP-like cAMP-binding protein
MQGPGFPHGTRAAPARDHNDLLAALLRRRPRLADSVEAVEGRAGWELHALNTRPTHFYFPVDGLVTTRVALERTRFGTAMPVGVEGLVGLPPWFGLDEWPCEVVQVAAGRILRVPHQRLCTMLSDDAGSRRLVQRYAAYALQQAWQDHACALHHPIERRMSRWLITLSDRQRTAQLRLTHQQLASMLGVRRQTVGDIAIRLRSNGLLEYRRGRWWLDRPRLAAASCSCHRMLLRCYREIVGQLL